MATEPVSMSERSSTPARPAVRTPGVGIHIGATDQSMDLCELAVAIEARGLDSLFLPEHTHIPVSRATPYPGGGDIPGRYLRLWDPLVALTWVAARTNLVVGNCIGLPGEHDPIALAKAIATLDVQSGGRFVMGVGFGWNAEEFEDHGYPVADKYAVVTEKIQVMKRLWVDEVASFSGEHVSLSPSWSWPKPLQHPHPPVLVGGRATPATFRRVADWGDGWIPMSPTPHETLEMDLKRLREVVSEAGRDPSTLHIMVMQRPEPIDRLREIVSDYWRLGVTRVLIDLPTAGADILLPLLDEVAPVTGTIPATQLVGG
ncbi:LLM class F420-dependent oxidoreductase [Amycolatopsis sp. GM8]|uniref:LLM class F420-dependent oxidoreductase n=1 Tax=Amycolatopsis sp. GM8 TaxID=2896530 RepID=UPI001F47B1E8|nr:LLM class F420-dependent oxidoreductase [Amycolatopsis sp. GM8]